MPEARIWRPMHGCAWALNRQQDNPGMEHQQRTGLGTCMLVDMQAKDCSRKEVWRCEAGRTAEVEHKR